MVKRMELDVRKTMVVHEDVRGTIVDVLNGLVVRHVSSLWTRGGSVRGNHYHLKKDQWLYMVQGEALALLRDTRTGAIREGRIVEGDVLHIPRLVTHAFRFPVDSHAIEMASEPFDPDDLIRDDIMSGKAT